MSTLSTEHQYTNADMIVANTQVFIDMDQIKTVVVIKFTSNRSRLIDDNSC